MDAGRLRDTISSGVVLVGGAVVVMISPAVTFLSLRTLVQPPLQFSEVVDGDGCLDWA